MSPGSFLVAHRPSSHGTGSAVTVLGLSCSAACGILVPHPRIKLMSPALQGRFLTTGPPGKSLHMTFSISVCLIRDACMKLWNPSNVAKAQRKLIFAPPVLLSHAQIHACILLLFLTNLQCFLKTEGWHIFPSLILSTGICWTSSLGGEDREAFQVAKP